MLLETKNLAEGMQKKIDELGWTAQKLADESGVARSTIYRIMNGENKKIRRAQAINLAEALGMNWHIRGGEITLTEKGQTEKEPDQIRLEEIEKFKKEEIREGILKLLGKVDAATMFAVEEMVRIVIGMDKMNIIEVTKLMQRLSKYEQKGMLLEKLRAFATLVQPYEEVEGTGEKFEGESSLFSHQSETSVHNN